MILLRLLIILLFSSSLVAEIPQKPPRIDPKSITQEQMNRYAETMGVKIGSKHISVDPKKRVYYDWRRDLKDLQIAKHIKGDKGIELKPVDYDKLMAEYNAKVETLKKKYEPEFARIRQQKIDKKNIITDSLNREYKRMTKPRPLERCRDDKTTKTRIGNDKSKFANSRQMDLLFIQPDLLPKFPEEYFGKGVMIRKYHNDKHIGIHRAAETLGVECLPYRFRITNNHVYRDYGENALKNYSDNFVGKGKLHDRFR